ncbi:MAG: hypothetical protein A3E01_03120 [Gammaproteobacteria bacterium RIFCSPHIGHO2_12_FULL_63_22]|nr:MAG: hypothetical protein A3E01_03120 [Gammaproteobacteria bacterium RIFCSPHIGHO2_12_FULL_63_22]
MGWSSEKFEQWCLVELFGHSRIAGFVTEQTIGGQSFVRVDVPETKLQKGFTRLFGSGAIYAMNPIAEDVARGLAKELEVKPITPWDFPEDLRQAISAGQKLLAAKPASPDEVDEDLLANEQ